MPFQAAAFQEQDNVRIELAYALPKFKLVADEKGFATVENGVYVFDADWQATFQQVSTRQERVSATGESSETGADSLTKNHLLSIRHIRVPAASYRLVVEARDGVSGSIGTIQMQRTFDDADSSFMVSDLGLARPTMGLPTG